MGERKAEKGEGEEAMEMEKEKEKEKEKDQNGTFGCFCESGSRNMGEVAQVYGKRASEMIASEQRNIVDGEDDDLCEEGRKHIPKIHQRITRSIVHDTHEHNGCRSNFCDRTIRSRQELGSNKDSVEFNDVIDLSVSPNTRKYNHMVRSNSDFITPQRMKSALIYEQRNARDETRKIRFATRPPMMVDCPNTTAINGRHFEGNFDIATSRFMSQSEQQSGAARHAESHEIERKRKRSVSPDRFWEDSSRRRSARGRDLYSTYQETETIKEDMRRSKLKKRNSDADVVFRGTTRNRSEVPGTNTYLEHSSALYCPHSSIDAKRDLAINTTIQGANLRRSGNSFDDSGSGKYGHRLASRERQIWSHEEDHSDGIRAHIRSPNIELQSSNRTRERLNVELMNNTLKRRRRGSHDCFDKERDCIGNQYGDIETMSQKSNRARRHQQTIYGDEVSNAGLKILDKAGRGFEGVSLVQPGKNIEGRWGRRSHDQEGSYCSSVAANQSIDVSRNVFDIDRRRPRGKLDQHVESISVTGLRDSRNMSNVCTNKNRENLDRFPRLDHNREYNRSPVVNRNLAQSVHFGELLGDQHRLTSTSRNSLTNRNPRGSSSAAHDRMLAARSTPYMYDFHLHTYGDNTQQRFTGTRALPADSDLPDALFYHHDYSDFGDVERELTNDQMLRQLPLQLRLALNEDDFTADDYEELLKLDECNIKRGLPQQKIAALPTKKFSAREVVNEKCCICLEKFTKSQSLKVLPCSHKFHGKCIDKWLRERARCPICMKDVKF